MTLRALTIWQPWASLIAIGAKPYEFRKWPAHQAFVGQRIVIHAGVRPLKRDELVDVLLRCDGGDGPPPVVPEIARPFLTKLIERFDAAHSSARGKLLPLGAGICSAVLGAPVRCVELFPADSDRIDHHMFAWPLTDIQAFNRPVPARGAQGFWPWAADMEREARCT